MPLTEIINGRTWTQVNWAGIGITHLEYDIKLAALHAWLNTFNETTSNTEDSKERIKKIESCGEAYFINYDSIGIHVFRNRLQHQGFSMGKAMKHNGPNVLASALSGFFESNQIAILSMQHQNKDKHVTDSAQPKSYSTYSAAIRIHDDIVIFFPGRGETKVNMKLLKNNFRDIFIGHKDTYVTSGYIYSITLPPAAAGASGTSRKRSRSPSPAASEAKRHHGMTEPDYSDMTEPDYSDIMTGMTMNFEDPDDDVFRERFTGRNW